MQLTRLDDGDAPVTRVRLSNLLTSADRALVVQHVMDEWSGGLDY